jgi:hypothetical protein
MNLWKHQQALIDLNPKKWLLAWECGTGKTLAMLSLINKNQQQGGAIYKCLIICPKSIKEQWEEIIDDYCEGKDDWRSSYTVMTKEEFKSWVINTKKPEKYSRLIIDEAHHQSGVKLNPKQDSMMFKTMYAYVQYAKSEYIYLATATPYLSTPLNILSYGLILGRQYENNNWNRWTFRKRFFYSFNIGKRKIWQPKKDIKEDMADLVSKLGNTVSMEDTLTDTMMPEQLFQQEYFELTKEQKKAIDNIEEEGIVRWTKVHQICGGTLKGDGYVDDQLYKSEKYARLKELIEENDKMIVVCRYNNEIKALQELVTGDKKALVINGATKNKKALCDEAEASERAVVFIQASTSEGYELPSYPLMVFYSYDFSLKNYIQVIGRIHRRDKLKRNVYKSLIVKNTIDEHVYKSIKNKEDFQIEIYNNNNK